mgnify:CR=1 FL=1
MHHSKVTPKSKARPRSPNSVRIIGGTHRTRRIQFPDAPGLRPTHDRIRETLFNWLRDEIRGARCLDLFAGSGALGFESLSRGASWVEFVDSNRQVNTAIKDALTLLKLENATVHCANASHWIETQTAREQGFDVVFLDPPFGENLLPEVCKLLAESAMLNPACKIYLEMDASKTEIEMPATWTLLKSKRTGSVSFRLYAAPGVSGD